MKNLIVPALALGAGVAIGYFIWRPKSSPFSGFGGQMSNASGSMLGSVAATAKPKTTTDPGSYSGLTINGMKCKEVYKSDANGTYWPTGTYNCPNGGVYKKNGSLVG